MDLPVHITLEELLAIEPMPSEMTRATKHPLDILHDKIKVHHEMGRTPEELIIEIPQTFTLFGLSVRIELRRPVGDGYWQDLNQRHGDN